MNSAERRRKLTSKYWRLVTTIQLAGVKCYGSRVKTLSRTGRMGTFTFSRGWAKIADLEHRLEILDWRSVRASDREELLKAMDKIGQALEMNR